MPLFNTSNSWRTSSSSSSSRQPKRPPSASRTHPRADPLPPPPPSEPLDQRTASLTQLDSLLIKLTSLISFFHPPPLSALEFAPIASLQNPKLAFSPPNAPVHAYEEELTRLMTELDGVDSGGDEQVRGKRKQLVVEVQEELTRVEEEVRREGWRLQREDKGGKVQAPSVAAASARPAPPRPIPPVSSSSSSPTTAPLPGRFSHPPMVHSSPRYAPPSAPSHANSTCRSDEHDGWSRSSRQGHAGASSRLPPPPPPSSTIRREGWIDPPSSRRDPWSSSTSSAERTQRRRGEEGPRYGYRLSEGYAASHGHGSYGYGARTKDVGRE